MKRKTVKFDYDRDTDAAYLTIARGKVQESEEVEPGLIVDFGANGEILGVEILRFSRRFGRQPKPSKKLAG
jgi:uncharacterized protein YuzE